MATADRDPAHYEVLPLGRRSIVRFVPFAFSPDSSLACVGSRKAVAAKRPELSADAGRVSSGQRRLDATVHILTNTDDIATGVPIDPRDIGGPGLTHGLVARSSHLIFLELQRQAAEMRAREGRGLKKAELTWASMQYWGVLRDQLFEMDAVCEQSDAGGLHALRLRYQNEASIWQLAHIFWLDTPASGCVTGGLIQWLRLHWAPSEPDLADPWLLLWRLAMHGRTQDALSVLRLNAGRGAAAAEAEKALLILDGLVTRLLAHEPLAEILPALNEWRSWCTRAPEREKAIAADPNISKLFAILSGDAATLESLAASWSSLLVARLLFVCPAVKAFEMTDLAQDCLRATTQNPSSLDAILLAIIDTDVDRAVHLAGRGASGWLAAHLLDVLVHCEMAEDFVLEAGLSRRDAALLDYTLALMAEPEHWQIAATYLAYCPTGGAAVLETLLERQPLESVRKAAKVVAVAEAHGLEEVARLCNRVVGRRLLRAGRLAAAIPFCIRGRDSVLLAAAVDNALASYLEGGPLADVGALSEALGDGSAAASRVLFLGQCRDYQRLLAAGEGAKAARVLVRLLASGTVPPQYVCTLLVDAVPLLEAPEILVSAEETTALMRLLESTVASHRADELTATVPELEREMVRLALARNLARALVSTLSPSAGLPLAAGAYSRV